MLSHSDEAMAGDRRHLRSAEFFSLFLVVEHQMIPSKWIRCGVSSAGSSVLASRLEAHLMVEASNWEAACHWVSEHIMHMCQRPLIN